MKLTAAIIALLPAAAFGQSNAPPICQQGAACIQDAKGIFVTADGIHVFNGIPYQLPTTYHGISKGGALFYFTTSDCSGTPYIGADDAAIPGVEVDTDGAVYAAKRPHGVHDFTAGSYSFGLSGPCNTYPTIGNVEDLSPAFVVDKSFVNSLTPPFGPYSRGHNS